MNAGRATGGFAWHHGLKQRLALAIGVLSLAATVLLSALTSHIVRRQIEADQGGLLRQIAHDMSGQLAQDLATRAEQLVFAAAQPVLRDPGTAAGTRDAFLVQLARTHRSFAWLGMADSAGRIVASTEPRILGQSVAVRDWFIGGRKGLYFGDAHEAKLLAGYLPAPKQDGLPLRLVDIAIPVFDADGVFIGVLAAHLSLDWAFELRQQMLERAADESIDVAVVKQDGGLLIGRNSLVPVSGAKTGPIRATGAAQGQETQVRTWKDDDRPYLTAAVPVAAQAPFTGLGWKVLARKPVDRAFARAQALSLEIALWGIAVCAVFLGCLWLILGRETRALRRLGTTAERIAYQDLDTPIPPPEGHGEVAVFTRSLVSLVSALQQSRAGFRRLFEDAPVALCHADPQGRILALNKRFVHVLGHGPAEVHALDALWDLACPDQRVRDKARDAWQAAAARAGTDGGEVEVGEFTLRHKDGGERIVQMSGMIDASGIMIALHDVSGERRAENQLRMWARAFEQAQTGLVLVDARTEHIIAANRAFASQRGYALPELGGMPVATLFPPDRREEMRRIVASVNAAGHGVFESEHQRRDGSRFPVLIDLTKFDADDGGPVGRLAIVHDISERKRIEAELAQTQAAALALEQRARLATLNQMQDANAARARAESALAALRLSEAQLGLFIEHAPAALAMFDRDMRYLAVSRRWRDDYQMGARKLIGEAHYEVYPGVRDDWKAIHRRGMAGEVIRNDADRLDRADGTTQWLRWEVRPWRDAGGQVGGILIFSEDITRQKAAEDEVRSLNEALEARVQERTAELTQANRELDSFAHAVTHDLRGPLRAMDGYVHILEEDFSDRMPADALNLVQQLRRSGVRMGELIDAIYALSNVSRGDIERAPVDVSAMSQSLLETLTRTDPAHRPGWTVEPGMTVEGDRRMLESVMQNLIANAWKYTGKTAHPEIRIHTQIIDGRQWICVTDNGAGFSMAQARRLFTPFQRLHRQEDFPGIGIGLATVLRIIRRHGGDIAAHGEPGRGATFRFTLPASPQAALSRTLRTPVLAS